MDEPPQDDDELGVEEDFEENRTLPIGYELRDGSHEGHSHFRIDKVLGIGGFGIGYLAYDGEVECEVVVKELFPSGVVARAEDGIAVSLVDPNAKAEFEWSLDQFIDEGKALAKFRAEGGIVTVLQTFRANGTAYMVTDYEPGRDLTQYLRELGRRPTEDEVLGVLRPVLRGLAEIHSAGYLHRDIASDNIIIRHKDNRPVLIDFGSSQKPLGGERALKSSIAVKPKYAPYEFYDDDNCEQGPWSDFYSLGAVAHKMITGKLPPDANDRSGKKDPYVPVAKRPELKRNYSSEFLNGLDSTLRFDGSARPQSAKELLEALPKTKAERREVVYRSPKFIWALVVVLMAGLGFAGYGLFEKINPDHNTPTAELMKVAADLQAGGNWIAAARKYLRILDREDAYQRDSRDALNVLIKGVIAEKQDVEPPGDDIFAIIRDLKDAEFETGDLEAQISLNLKNAPERGTSLEAAQKLVDSGDKAAAIKALLEIHKKFTASRTALRRLEFLVRREISDTKRLTLEENRAAKAMLEPIRPLGSITIDNLWKKLEDEEAVMRDLLAAEGNRAAGRFGSAALTLAAILNGRNAPSHLAELAREKLVEILAEPDKFPDSDVKELFAGWGENWDSIRGAGIPELDSLFPPFEARLVKIAELEKQLERIAKLEAEKKWAEALSECARLIGDYPGNELVRKRVDDVGYAAWEASDSASDRISFLRSILNDSSELRDICGAVLIEAELVRRQLRAHEEVDLESCQSLADRLDKAASGSEYGARGFYTAGLLFYHIYLSNGENVDLQRAAEAFENAIASSRKIDSDAMIGAKLRIASIIIEDCELRGETVRSRFNNANALLKTLEDLTNAYTYSLFPDVTRYASVLQVQVYQQGLLGIEPDISKAITVARAHARIENGAGKRWWSKQLALFDALYPAKENPSQKTTELLNVLRECSDFGFPAATLYYYRLAHEKSQTGFSLADYIKKLESLRRSILSSTDGAAKDTDLVDEVENEIEMAKSKLGR